MDEIEGNAYEARLRDSRRPRADARYTSFQVKSSSEVMWYAWPMACGLPSSPTKPRAKSVLCVSTHSDRPSPATTTGRPRRMRSIIVHPPCSGSMVAS